MAAHVEIVKCHMGTRCAACVSCGKGEWLPRGRASCGK